MKMSDKPFSGTVSVWNDGRVLALDANGWPTSLASGQYARYLILGNANDGSQLGSARPAGEITILYDGAGTLEYFGV